MFFEEEKKLHTENEMKKLAADNGSCISLRTDEDLWSRLTFVYVSLSCTITFMVSSGNICVLTTLRTENTERFMRTTALMSDVCLNGSSPSSEENTAGGHQGAALTGLQDEGGFEEEERVHLQTVRESLPVAHQRRQR